MKFSIPTNKINNLKKIINKYQKKGANITFIIGDKTIEQGKLIINDPTTHTSKSFPIKVECYEVEVEGSYKINGWSFVGTIDFTPNGNIIRLADSSFDGKVPEKYKHTGKVCEHCGKIRNRKDTYLIYNEENDEFKQVGSTCLLEYTQGLDAEVCAGIMSCLEQIKTLNDYDCTLDEFIGNGFDSVGMGVDSKKLKALAIGLVKAHGYTRNFDSHKGTAYDLSNLYFHNLPKDVEEQLFSDVILATDEEVKEIDNFASENKESNNNYMRNASLAWLKNYIEGRDFGLICSFVNTYLKNKQEKEEKASSSNEYVGSIGERITFTINNFRVLYTKRPYVYNGEYTYVYEIKDELGHTFIWSTTSIDLKVGSKITATVKEHKEYNGLKQTVITRGKILEN